MIIFLLSQHKGLNIEEELCRDKRQRVATEHGKNVTSQLRQRKIMLRQGLSAECQHQEEPVATLETGRKQKIYRDKKLKRNKGRILRQVSLCCDILKNRRKNLCHDGIFSCRDTDYCNLEKPVETQRIRKRKTSAATRQSMSQH